VEPQSILELAHPPLVEHSDGVANEPCPADGTDMVRLRLARPVEHPLEIDLERVEVGDMARVEIRTRPPHAALDPARTAGAKGCCTRSRRPRGDVA
jgi:hypothetical protein